MTIRDQAAQLQREANARGGSTLLLWAADTLEAMHKALAEAEWDNGECKHCTHRGDDRYCHICVGGRFWEWSGKAMKKFTGSDLVTLKTAEEQAREIDKQIDFLRFEEAREKWLYDDRVREIHAKIKKLREEKEALHENA